MTEVLRSDTDGRVATLTLSRPERRNAIDRELNEVLLAELDRLSGDDAISVIVLRGSEGSFSVGGDLEAGAGGGVDTGIPEQLVSSLRGAMRTAQRLRDVPQVTIAAIDGPCAGAGLSWACACDLRYASYRSRFSTAFVDAGVSGDFGGTWTLPRIVGPAKARELYLLGDRFGADEARTMGLVSDVFPTDDFDEKVAEVAGRLAAKAPLALRAVKANLNDADRLSFSEALDREAERHVRCAFTADAAEAAAAFLGKREPRFEGR
ncbi:MAG: enoyl-CoA hydratase/isomerase family protein [Actinobacteria bacterium]|nr:enoyl-CoA hydratase/isomerase family protein [Actinomycetota bacterium]